MRSMRTPSAASSSSRRVTARISSSTSDAPIISVPVGGAAGASPTTATPHRAHASTTGASADASPVSPTIQVVGRATAPHRRDRGARAAAAAGRCTTTAPRAAHRRPSSCDDIERMADERVLVDEPREPDPHPVEQLDRAPARARDALAPDALPRGRAGTRQLRVPTGERRLGGRVLGDRAEEAGVGPELHPDRGDEHRLRDGREPGGRRTGTARALGERERRDEPDVGDPALSARVRRAERPAWFDGTTTVTGASGSLACGGADRVPQRVRCRASVRHPLHLRHAGDLTWGVRHPLGRRRRADAATPPLTPPTSIRIFNWSVDQATG